MTELIDVSAGNFPIDYGALAKSGVSGIWIEVGDGTVRNPHFTHDEIHKARIAGLHVGGYYYCEFRAGRTARQEVDANFITPLKQAGYGLGGHDLRPILDLETSHVDPAHTLNYLEDAVVEMARAFTGHHPIIYLGSYWRDTLGNPSRASLLKSHPQIAGCQLMQSFYGSNDGNFHPITSQYAIHGWPEVTIQQYTGDAVGAPGVQGNVDKDRLLHNLNINLILI
jgi:GH25 family lysozyme M1 (1,4-beta-N-acetylmuramidase)